MMNLPYALQSRPLRTQRRRIDADVAEPFDVGNREEQSDNAERRLEIRVRHPERVAHAKTVHVDEPAAHEPQLTATLVLEDSLSGGGSRPVGLAVHSADRVDL